MIKNTELRIGNLLSLKNEVTTIKGMASGYVDDFEVAYTKIWCDKTVYGYRLVNFEPIPLTEKWLLDFGANEKQSSWLKLNGYWLTKISDTEWVIYGTNATYLVCKLYYVHQLQNLYFALTGEELTIK